jgi:hypothetical protein
VRCEVGLGETEALGEEVEGITLRLLFEVGEMGCVDSVERKEGGRRTD